MSRVYVARKSESVVFNGITFRRYPMSKHWAHRMYYSPHAGHRRNGVGCLHEEVWKAAHGPIPDGHEIHHKDRDSLSNALENLACLTKAEHDAEHHDDRSARAVISDAARAAAAKWHASPEGHAWHKQHGKDGTANLPLVTVQCRFCGQDYQTICPKRAQFCGQNCRQKFYRRQRGGGDPQKATCEHCHREYTRTKNNVQRYCSALCKQRFKMAADQAARIARGENVRKTGPRTGLQPVS